MKYKWIWAWPLGYLLSFVVACAFILLVDDNINTEMLKTAVVDEPFVIFVFMPVVGGCLLIAAGLYLFLCLGVICGIGTLAGAALSSLIGWKNKLVAQNKKRRKWQKWAQQTKTKTKTTRNA